ncbi:hypothetical protein K490DRAFT_65740 [Saccharata proteae CBS 121410]|uniref:SGF29 C-terminal domain-containing protein n=1 Tax=Saccharata proteae CBS 121410 TaxID=1314787 RepID=A0A9P4HV69_9PEZI|nr:hypothetical protein K490DRAFT_65740 [Saccharata proteae CBS 121410]
MTSRSRPRGAQLKNDADEERDIWMQLRQDAKKVDALVKESNAIEKRIFELGTAQQDIEVRGDMPPAEIDNELEELCRKNIRLHEEIQGLTAGDSSDTNMSITQQLELLSALRAASAQSPDAAVSNGGSRNASVGKIQRNPKRKLDLASSEDIDSVAADSPRPTATAGAAAAATTAAAAAATAAGSAGSASSSSATTAAVGLGSGLKDRLGVGSSKANSRSGSVGALRETSVKVEEGEGGMDGLKGGDSRHRLTVGTEVFYRNKQKNTEGEGILCQITSVIGEGKQRRYWRLSSSSFFFFIFFHLPPNNYEIIDSDPDPPTPPQPYRASVSALIPIPITNAGLSELPLRKNVLALYPSTTTFYKAEVVASRPGKGIKKDGKEVGGSLGPLKDGFVRLRFEGEDEADREMDVERRYVLPDTLK